VEAALAASTTPAPIRGQAIVTTTNKSRCIRIPDPGLDEGEETINIIGVRKSFLQTDEAKEADVWGFKHRSRRCASTRPHVRVVRREIDRRRERYCILAIKEVELG
jgi:hypothetical protein